MSHWLFNNLKRLQIKFRIFNGHYGYLPFPFAKCNGTLRGASAVEVMIRDECDNLARVVNYRARIPWKNVRKRTFLFNILAKLFANFHPKLKDKKIPSTAWQTFLKTDKFRKPSIPSTPPTNYLPSPKLREKKNKHPSVPTSPIHPRGPDSRRLQDVARRIFSLFPRRGARSSSRGTRRILNSTAAAAAAAPI